MIDPELLRLLWLLLWGVVIGSCAFALWRGGTPERIGAALVLAVALIAGLVDWLIQDPARSLTTLVLDAVLALGFLAVALRYTSLWLGGAMLFQSVQFSLHGFYFLTDRPRDLLHFTINNLDTLGIMACLVLGALASRRASSA